MLGHLAAKSVGQEPPVCLGKSLPPNCSHDRLNLDVRAFFHKKKYTALVNFVLPSTWRAFDGSIMPYFAISYGVCIAVSDRLKSCGYMIIAPDLEICSLS